MNQPEQKNKIAELEALLFYYGEPLSFKKIADFLEIKEEETKILIDDFEKTLNENEAAGLTVLRDDKTVQLVTKPIFKNIAKKIMSEEFREELTPAALEALTILAYWGPLSRSAVDYIRGVNSSFILRSLMVRGLIGRQTHPKGGSEASALLPPKRRNVYFYNVSLDFLKHLGLNKIEELNDYNKYREVLKNFEIPTL